MRRVAEPALDEKAERKALRARVKRFYAHFNNQSWERCFALIDPRLRQQGKVESNVYSERMQTFKNVYGHVNLWITRVSLHLSGAPRQHDPRPFAFVYVIWKDDAHAYHMFRERWIREDGRWFTRVVGLVPNMEPAGAARV